ncbi:unnamed protein product [Ceratitis capitata]|uniref:(Mediterranean fruit fly) hypothetical protein n=1 Tax=Ceratitis capitata TaxID=7213 RepID=A0A811VET4_CERCA|nr:unnamed protein product [Ceratitis capitata]
MPRTAHINHPVSCSTVDRFSGACWRMRLLRLRVSHITLPVSTALALARRCICDAENAERMRNVQAHAALHSALTVASGGLQLMRGCACFGVVAHFLCTGGYCAVGLLHATTTTRINPY